MTVLLDTNVLLRAASAPERLGEARQVLLDADRRLLSAASTWELAIKQGIGLLALGADTRSWVRRAVAELDLELLSITSEHAAVAEDLPPVHRDPFDRILVAQATSEGAELLTADNTLVEYGPVVHYIPERRG